MSILTKIKNENIEREVELSEYRSSPVPHVAGDIMKFSTGAVRSSDAEGYRYDLVSPIGVRRMLAYLYTAKESLARTDRDAIWHVDACIGRIYGFLGGDRGEPHLEKAAELLFAAIEHDADVTISVGELSPTGVQGIAEACHEGAAKYSDFNWERGMPCHDLLNHAVRHLMLYKSDDQSEEHLAHAAWNLFAAMHSEQLWPKLNEGKLRLPGCIPPIGKQ